jgi:pimeloyl-ACP methyl ester carboxylesterase
MPRAHVNGIGIYYETAGEGQPLLFLHGLGSSAQDWAPQVSVFQNGYRCITMDVRGHGQSDKPPGPYSVRQFAADAAGLLQALGIPSAHLIGLSMGGMIAFQMAVDMPGCVRSMVIINSEPEVPMRTLQEKMAVWQRLMLFRLFSMKKIGETIGARLFPDDNQAALRAAFVARWATNDKRAYLDATRALAGWSVRDRIASIAVPTLVIAADQDYTPVAAKEAYVRQMPDARLVVAENARHAVNFAQPEKVNPTIGAFLEEVSRAG